jgi:diguanylate cyclase
MSPLPLSDDPTQPWLRIQQSTEASIRARVSALVLQSAEVLATQLYDEMLTHEELRRVVNHALVHSRLHAAMSQWLRFIFDEKSSVQDILARQRQAGELHARVGVTFQWVTASARVLKRVICNQLADQPMSTRALVDAVAYVHEWCDLAVDEMNATTADNAKRMARSEESYRLNFLGQNMWTERERRRSELLEWSHQIQQVYYWHDHDEPATAAHAHFHQTPFGLWLQHKAPMLFDHAPEIGLILAQVALIEEQWLPQLGQVRTSHAQARAVVQSINRSINEIKDLLTSLFDCFTDQDSGRDSVTHLLHRRYFPLVIKREIELAHQARGSFGLLMLEIDGLHALSQNLGQESAEAVLAQVAESLSDSVRAGDFAFRIGDEQFLVLLVEATAESVPRVAEGLRERVAELSLRTKGPARTRMTASIGMAVFDGHPDYQRLVDKAAQALEQAKRDGGDRCQTAT